MNTHLKVLTKVFGFIILPFLADASESCFLRHIQEAIKLNEIRKPIYTSHYGGYSAEISDRLIEMEKGLILSAWGADLLARRHHQNGAMVLCNELQEMNRTPSLPALLPLKDWPLEKDFIDFNISKMQKDLKKSLEHGFPSFNLTVQKYLNQLHVEPRLNCLVRHFLESLRAFGMTNAIYKQDLKTADYEDLKSFTKLIMRSHIYLQRESHEIDKLAKNVQLYGLPIICQDVPPIPEPIFQDKLGL